MVANKEVDKVADMGADKNNYFFFFFLADIELDVVANKEVDKDVG